MSDGAVPATLPRHRDDAGGQVRLVEAFRPAVTAGGTGSRSHTGTVPLRALAERAGLRAAYSADPQDLRRLGGRDDGPHDGSKLDPACLGLGRSLAVSYREASRYRPPPRAHQRITRVMGCLAATSLSPQRVVVLEVLGRLSGRPRRTVVVLAEYAGHDYVISLGGESEWVRNVRARGGDATVLHGRRRSVRLMDVPPQERAPILKAYARRRAASRSPAYIAREYFGVRPDAPPSDFAAIADRYPVFRVTPPPTDARPRV